MISVMQLLFLPVRFCLLFIDLTRTKLYYDSVGILDFHQQATIAWLASQMNLIALPNIEQNPYGLAVAKLLV